MLSEAPASRGGDDDTLDPADRFADAVVDGRPTLSGSVRPDGSRSGDARELQRRLLTAGLGYCGPTLGPPLEARLAETVEVVTRDIARGQLGSAEETLSSCREALGGTEEWRLLCAKVLAANGERRAAGGRGLGLKPAVVLRGSSTGRSWRSAASSRASASRVRPCGSRRASCESSSRRRGPDCGTSPPPTSRCASRWRACSRKWVSGRAPRLMPPSRHGPQRHGRGGVPRVRLVLGVLRTASRCRVRDLRGVRWPRRAPRR